MGNEIQKRIQQAVDTLCDGNKSEFCRRINRPAQAIKDIVGGKGSAPGYDLIYDILSSDLGISPKWLILGDGDMLSGFDSPEAEPQPNTAAHTLPLIPLEAFAGPGLPTYEDMKIEDYYTVTDFKNSDFLIRVKGDSMTPKYNGGDLVACKKVTETYFLQWGRVYVIYTQSQGIMIKRVEPADDNDYIKCVSDNPKYAPFDVPKSDIVSIALVNGAITLD